MSSNICFFFFKDVGEKLHDCSFYYFSAAGMHNECVFLTQKSQKPDDHLVGHIMKTHPVWKQPNCYYYGADDDDADYGMMFQPQLIN